ncbi:hypothetical protein N7517_011475 [Penicillium concentricum]|uniref:Uncharacterized protein n=1 Tax=Penicillium concentricum TaxID=293559 RepID=A0A9W9RAZ7_9EURO|nr:uncharacterized protein N7517_011475 [Penicillium concentricum]KAJ5356866.1 hypothetical protein N7517_011475 [Penicillium concentricum]
MNFWAQIQDSATLAGIKGQWGVRYLPPLLSQDTSLFRDGWGTYSARVDQLESTPCKVKLFQDGRLVSNIFVPGTDLEMGNGLLTPGYCVHITGSVEDDYSVPNVSMWLNNQEVHDLSVTRRLGAVRIALPLLRINYKYCEYSQISLFDIWFTLLGAM